MPKAAVPGGGAAITVCLTGGGTAGHVTPHFALLPGMAARHWDSFYIGSAGLEKPLVEARGIPFFAISTGKLRRYLSFQNLLDLFKVVLGSLQAAIILLKRRPDVVFSKGGFVAVPVAVAAWVLRIPVVSHESDMTPGLANKLIAPLAKKIVFTFPDTKRHLPGSAEEVGTPIRPELFEGVRARGLDFCGFSAEDLPTYLVMGGSQGAQRINDALKEALPTIVIRARVIHLTGAGKSIGFDHPRYKAFEFVRDEMKDVLAAADFVVSRAGANSIFEYLALKKPMLLIPLDLDQSRGDQIVNAEAFAKAGWAAVLREKDLTAATLLAAMARLESGADAMRIKQRSFDGRDAAAKILGVLERVIARR